ncbi:hypothetical protein ACFFF5_11225 [Lederbergia wuyishanensis]|uniref:Uncharacterized protein n=1 Tax=Lederbergia wuyishanensis TaxID=1347903 RepID=A0ABU0D4A1_9BACI|nr:hypothetical protein [Lederbergia wuyishanensis]MCJ8008200.1 hypothetical protein [Lederbergia wuyishanensis]MDQ0343211.1 hypothetical protein [Lederbergia wuyishanensis]
MSKLGSNARPAVLYVHSEEKANELYRTCDEMGWKVVINVDPDKPEDLLDYQRLMGKKVKTRS